MQHLSRREWIIIGALLIFSFIPNMAGLLRMLELSGGPSILPQNPRAVAMPLPIVMHIAASFLFCIFGIVQFTPSLRKFNINFHRALGRLLALSGIVSALTGLYMTLVFAFPAELQGALLYGVRLILAPAMAGLIIWAVIAVRNKNVPAHRAAMLRAYAIGQGASTQAVIGILWVIITGAQVMGPLRDVLMVAAWAINLAVVEWLIRKKANNFAATIAVSRLAK